METTAKEPPDKKRLAQLETEGQHIIDSYLKQVTVDANAVLLKTLQNRLKEVRAEQWKIFDKITPVIAAVRLSAAA